LNYNPPEGHQGGFTLIEILVVMVIITVVTSIAVATLPGFVTQQDFDKEAARLKAVLELGMERAIVQAEEIGVSVEKNGYQFSVYDPLSESWQQLVETPFQPRQLPDQIQLRTRVEGTGFGETEQGVPSILMLSSGEVTPFEIDVSEAELIRTLKTDGFSGVHWVDELQDDEP